MPSERRGPSNPPRAFNRVQCPATAAKLIRKILSLPQRKNEKPCRLKTDLFNLRKILRKDYIGHGWAPPESGGEAETALADAMSQFSWNRIAAGVGRGFFSGGEGERENYFI